MDINGDEEKKAKEHFNKIGAAFHSDCYQDNKPEGCHHYAEYLCVVKKEFQEAVELFRKVCDDMKFSESCLALGNMYLTGKGVDKDLSKALSVYEKSCDQGSMGGCNNAGLVLQNGHQSSAPDGKMAERYFKRSCNGNFKNGCFNLSLMYLQGTLIDKDMEKALEYSVRSCELGHPWGCGNASRILRTGDGVPKDTKKGDELLKRAKTLMK